MAGYETLLDLVARAQELLYCKENRFIEKFHNLKSFNCDSAVTKEIDKQEIDERKKTWFRYICYESAIAALDEAKKNRTEIEQKIVVLLKEADDSVLRSKQPKNLLDSQWCCWFSRFIDEIALEMILKENKDISPKSDELMLFAPFAQRIEKLIKEPDPFDGAGVESILTEKLSVVVCAEMNVLAGLTPLFSETVEALVQRVSRIEENINMSYALILYALSRIKREKILDTASKLILDDDENLTQSVSKFNESYSDKENKISEYCEAALIFVPIFLENKFVSAEPSPFLGFSGDFDLLIKNLRGIIKTINFAENRRFSIDELKQLQNSGSIELRKDANEWLGSFVLDCKDFFKLGGRINATNFQKKENCEFIKYIETLKIPVGNTDDCKLRDTDGCPKFEDKIKSLSLLCRASLASTTYDDKLGIDVLRKHEGECSKTKGLNN